MLAKNGKVCDARFEQIWDSPPTGLHGQRVWQQCSRACSRCPAEEWVEQVEQVDGEEANGQPGVWVYDAMLPTSMAQDLQAAVQTNLWHRQFGQLWLELPIRQKAAQMDMMQSVFSYLLATVPPLKAEAWEVLEF